MFRSSGVFIMSPVWISLILGLFIRLVLMAYGLWQDNNMVVKYTDVDYFVFTDAAEFVTKDESPYKRATYRYTPLLAWLLQPNIWWSPLFGKLVFIFCDVLAGYLIYIIVKSQHRKESNSMAIFCAEMWLLNPLPMTVSSRGNAESVMAVLVLGTMYFLIFKKSQKSQLKNSDILIAGGLYGLSVHTKIYPVTYALPLYLYMDEHFTGKKQHSKSWTTTMKDIFGVDILPNKSRLLFVFAAGSVFGALTWICYIWCGQEFLQETYLYHVTRRDIRHNFSPYFYMLYLIGNDSSSIWVGLAAFIPQMALLLVISFQFYADLPFCCFLQTFVFVTFNKVCTSQYFLWYLSLLPLILPRMYIKVKEAILLVILWFLGQGIWLAPAYYLEIEGYNTFIFIWIAGFIFFWINIWILHRVIQVYKFSPIPKTIDVQKSDRHIVSLAETVLKWFGGEQKTRKD